LTRRKRDGEPALMAWQWHFTAQSFAAIPELPFPD